MMPIVNPILFNRFELIFKLQINIKNLFSLIVFLRLIYSMKAILDYSKKGEEEEEIFGNDSKNFLEKQEISWYSTREIFYRKKEPNKWENFLRHTVSEK